MKTSTTILTTLPAISAMVVLASIVTNVHGQTAPKAGQKHFNIINCSALKGAPQVCLSNNTDSQVTDIDCETTGFFGGKGAKAVGIPKGGIPAHSLTIVNMKSCKTALIFSILGEPDRKVNNVDTDQSTLIEVPQQ